MADMACSIAWDAQSCSLPTPIIPFRAFVPHHSMVALALRSSGFSIIFGVVSI
jgi:hypothetical protein